jgi:tetratricopeptide (TPR) repeat protein
MANVLGSSRTALSQSLYETADAYFHHGVPHTHREALTNSVFKRLAKRMHPDVHDHAEGDEVKEIMPWLRFATQMDPHNVEAYLVAAFWLASTVDQPQEALDVLREAQRNNPGDYRIYADKGRVYMFMHDKERAVKALERGLRLWPGNQDPQDEQTRIDLARMLSYRAFLYELAGQEQSALALFRRAQKITPGNPALERRVAMLENGQVNTEWAHDAWEHLFTVHEDEHDHGHIGSH